MFGEILPRSFYDRDVIVVAQELLGKIVVRRSRNGLCLGSIVETEAYLAIGDSASHSFRGQTKRNASMFGPPGYAYVYSIHSRYCMNAVTQGRGQASAVLIRAIQPLAGLAFMQAADAARTGCLSCVAAPLVCAKHWTWIGGSTGGTCVVLLGCGSQTKIPRTPATIRSQLPLALALRRQKMRNCDSSLTVRRL